jgi:hypothetical protein
MHETAQSVLGRSTFLYAVKDVAFSQSRAGISVMSALQVPNAKQAEFAEYKLLFLCLSLTQTRILLYYIMDD